MLIESNEHSAEPARHTAPEPLSWWNASNSAFVRLAVPLEVPDRRALRRAAMYKDEGSHLVCFSWDMDGQPPPVGAISPWRIRRLQVRPCRLARQLPAIEHDMRVDAGRHLRNDMRAASRQKQCDTVEMRSRVVSRFMHSRDWVRIRNVDAVSVLATLGMLCSQWVSQAWR